MNSRQLTVAVSFLATLMLSPGVRAADSAPAIPAEFTVKTSPLDVPQRGVFESLDMMRKRISSRRRGRRRTTPTPEPASLTLLGLGGLGLAYARRRRSAKVVEEQS